MASKSISARSKVDTLLQVQVQDDTPFPTAELMLLRQLPKGPKLQQTLKLFRGENSNVIYREISYFVHAETSADEVLILRMYGEDFEAVNTNTPSKKIHSSKKISGMSDAVYKRLPVLLERGLTASWKGIFKEQPEYLILIPVIVTSNKTLFIMGTAALAYYSDMPKKMEEERTWHILLDYLQLTVPLLINVVRYEESDARRQRYIDTLDAVARAEEDIHDIGNCIRALAYEVSVFMKVQYVQILSIQSEIVEEKKLHKYCHVGTIRVDKGKCPLPSCHERGDIPVTMDTGVGYVAATGKNFVANSPSDLVHYGIKEKFIHSIGGCIVSNILCLPLPEHSGEISLVLELSEKKGGFTREDEEQAQVFAKRAASIISSAILLDYKKKARRRHGIRNEVLANIGEVSDFKVNQLLDLKFDYSTSFRKKLEDFRFSMRLFPDHQSPGIIFYMFVDLGLIQRWNMRKSTLIRFILSMQEGYRAIAYHNWKHACCVTHFGYLMLKKLDLVKNGYLTELEALTLMISCLSHDVDHRGRNNHFQLCTKSELYHLYKQEDSIMERHHLAVTLSVLNTEDCNILQNLSDAEYKEFLELLQWNIMATDLSKYMQRKYEYIYTLSHFDATDVVHRKHFLAIIMTTADLSDNIKAWDINLATIKGIFYEFFSQGDDEIALGLKPMPLMDRKVAYIPQIEVQFTNSVVRPAYEALADLFPQMRVCVHTLDYQVDLWLVATSVFDANRNIDNPLLILDLPDMLEKNLRKKSTPELQKLLEEHGIPVSSIGHLGIKTGSTSSIASLTIENNIASASSIKGYEHLPEERKRSSIPLSPVIITNRTKMGCCQMTKNWLCCYICRNRGLVTARAVRQYKLEMEFLDKRVALHENRNSNYEIQEGDKPGGANTKQLY